jgi:tetratricopeptide (TPR) repeat protein/predicted Ser/Thr protein kinase
VTDDRERKADQPTVRAIVSDRRRPDRGPVVVRDAGPTQRMSDDDIAAASASAFSYGGGGIHPRGTQLGRYVVLSLLGAGGMGEVYTAYDPALDRRVALKVIKPLGDEGSISTARNLLLAEAQALAKLSHPNVVHVYDVGTIDDDVYMAMEYVQGTTLTAWLNTNPPLPDVIDMFIAAGRGLEAAHAAGIVHRDFKSDNVIIGEDGRVRVIDFGIAQRGARDEAEGIVGTPGYMAPEQVTRGAITPAADQFSFAVTLYVALYRQLPFDGDTDASLAFNIAEGNLRPLPVSKVPPQIRDAIMRALSREPALRFASMAELLAALAPPPRRRARWPFAVAAAALLAAVGAVVFLRHAGPEPCTGFEHDLDGIWDAPRKLALQHQVKPDAWSSIEHMFDTYAADWTRNKVAACRATAVTHEQSPAVLERRMSCLDTRRRELDAAVALAAGGGAPSTRAIELGANLRPASSCANLGALGPAPPKNVWPAAVQSIEGGIAKIRAKRLAGEFEDARRASVPVLSQARALGWTSAVARALVERGQAEAADGDPKAARETLCEAIRASEESDDPASAAAAWIELVSVEAAGLRAPTEALRWAKHADIALAKAGGDQAQQGELLHNIAAALRTLDRTEEALDHEQRALILLEHAFGAHSVRVANQRSSVATALRNTGKLDDAAREAEAALKLLEDLVGLAHPYVATLLNSLALTYDEQNRIDDARHALERAITINELELGPNHLRLANPLLNLASLERRAGHADTAEALWQRAYDIRLANLGPNHPDVTRALHGRMLDRVNRGLDDQARALIDEVITRQRTRSDPLELASALSQRCELERRAHSLDRAKATCNEAIAALPSPPDPGRALYVYAYATRVATDRHDLAAAHDLLAKAQAFLAGATRDKAVARGFVGWAAAHLALADGHRDEAAALAADARASLLSHGLNYSYLTHDLDALAPPATGNPDRSRPADRGPNP